MPSEYNKSPNDVAFEWLTTPGSIQAAQLESAMRHYDKPVYEPEDVGGHLLKALSMPMAGFTEDTTKLDMPSLAIAVITYASTMGWDVVEEIVRPS